jgi:hypothetical protein
VSFVVSAEDTKEHEGKSRMLDYIHLTSRAATDPPMTLSQRIANMQTK